MNNFELNRVMKISNFLFFLFISFNFIAGQDIISPEKLNQFSKTKNDSIKKSKIKQRDTVFEFNRKERSIKNRLSPKKYDTLQKRNQ